MCCKFEYCINALARRFIKKDLSIKLLCLASVTLSGHQKIDESVVYEKFRRLAETHFIHQTVDPLEVKVKDTDEHDELQRYKVPPLAAAGTCWCCHWVQSKRHRLWFSTKTCSCYSTKTYVDRLILILKLNLTSFRNILKCVWCLTKTTSNNYNVFIENHNLWRFDCTQWLLCTAFKICYQYL